MALKAYFEIMGVSSKWGRKRGILKKQRGIFQLKRSPAGGGGDQLRFRGR
jgi:hypothetical protein